MKINCLCCGFKMELDDYTYSDYEGQAKCFVCNQLLDIKTTDAKLNYVHLAVNREAPFVVWKEAGL